ncbi:hypothetical protein H4R34_004286 [Dimargaris verticillata]|uniref:DNA polymerase epsilon subunit D n=1 Tax=Dimargaris verticillata TaxID=2761393 RepID=A0A9W8ECD3_9FUNG|nr:hypothetical protein H4R34_004286 [Dimargaris verticillata]
MGIASDSKLAVGKATTVFISYIAAMANDIARSTRHKTVTLQHVMRALEEAEFDDYVPKVQAAVQDRQSKSKSKKSLAEADPARLTPDPKQDDDRDIEEPNHSSNVDIRPGTDSEADAGPHNDDDALDIDLSSEVDESGPDTANAPSQGNGTDSNPLKKRKTEG